MKSARLPVAIWLGLVAVCVLIVVRTEFSTDLAAFLPRSPTPAQQILVDELREGVVSRLILIGIEGAPGDKDVLRARVAVLEALSKASTNRNEQGWLNEGLAKAKAGLP